jgi:hypothetical protein
MRGVCATAINILQLMGMGRRAASEKGLLASRPAQHCYPKVALRSPRRRLILVVRYRGTSMWMLIVEEFVDVSINGGHSIVLAEALARDSNRLI